MTLVTATLATKIMRPEAIPRYNFQKNFAYFQNFSHPDLGRVFAREDTSHEVRPSKMRTPGEAKVLAVTRRARLHVAATTGSAKSDKIPNIPDVRHMTIMNIAVPCFLVIVWSDILS
jgi:hypothetical protein